VDPSQVYAGASPDAVVTCSSCCGLGILEVKCPISIAHADPAVCPPAYLESVDGCLLLKKSHEYHCQIQLQLSVTKATWCDFFVYTPHGYHCERIYADSDRKTEIKAAAESFFSRTYILTSCSKALL
jgi:YqaJ-like viral recombinase domain